MTDGSASFPDHFSAVAAAYATHRPTYPAALFDWIANVAPARDLVWDCACGSGQATAALAERFAHVIATDASAEQLSHAPATPRTVWKLATAEASGLPAHSVDAVTIAQALHWFDLDRFWPEVRRVVRPGGLVVAWSYGMPGTGDAALDETLVHFHDVTVGPWWPINRGHVDQGYRTLAFPFPRLHPPSFDMRVSWSLDQLLGYIGSWSATRRHRDAEGADPIPALRAALAPRWGAAARDVSWPLTVLAGRVMKPV